jgi:hypothetical protein
MEMMQMKFKFRVCCSFLAFLFIGASAGAVTYSWSYEHPKVASGDFHIRTACLMPVQGKLSKSGMKGSEGLSKESDAWSESLQNVVETHLKQSGIQLLSASDVLQSGASEDELRQVLLGVQSKYDEVSAQVNRKPKDIGKSRFTLGDSVALLPCAAKSDVLVFVEGEGQVLTGGKKAMGMLIGGASSSSAALILTMADAKTGELLAFVRLANAEKFLTDSEKAYGKGLDKQFKKMRIDLTADRTGK